MFLKNVFFKKKFIILCIISYVIPLFDPYYNLNKIDHLIFSLKTLIILIIISRALKFLIKKIKILRNKS